MAWKKESSTSRISITTNPISEAMHMILSADSPDSEDLND